MTILSDGQLGQGLRQLQMLLQVIDSPKKYQKVLKDMGVKLEALEKAQAEYSETRRKVDGADARIAATEQALVKRAEGLDQSQKALEDRADALQKRLDQFADVKAAQDKACRESERRVAKQEHAVAVQAKEMEVLAKQLSEREKGIAEREAALAKLEAEHKEREARLEKAMRG